MTEFKIVYNKSWNEYQVVCLEDGQEDIDRTYFTDDKEDAKLTLKAMRAEQKRNDLRG